MNSRGGPLFFGLYSVYCMLMNSRGGPPILRGGPPLGTISMDQTVLILNSFSFDDKDPRFARLKPVDLEFSFSKGLFYIRAMVAATTTVD